MVAGGRQELGPQGCRSKGSREESWTVFEGSHKRVHLFSMTAT